MSTCKQRAKENVSSELKEIAASLKAIEAGKDANGVFYGSAGERDHIPRGQAILSSLLNECWQRLASVRFLQEKK